MVPRLIFTSLGTLFLLLLMTAIAIPLLSVMREKGWVRSMWSVILIGVVFGGLFGGISWWLSGTRYEVPSARESMAAPQLTNGQSISEKPSESTKKQPLPPVVIPPNSVVSIDQKGGITEGANLELVELAVDDTKGSYPMIEVKLRNLGQGVVFLKKAQFHVTNVYGLRSRIQYSRVPISWNYDVLLPDDSPPYVTEIDISQSIKPNDVDRFTFTLGTKKFEYQDIGQIFRLQVKLIYNEDNKELTTDYLLLFMAYPARVQAFTETREYSAESSKKNMVVLKSISELQGIRSKTVEGFLKSVR